MPAEMLFAFALAAAATAQDPTRLSLHGVWEGRVEPEPQLFFEGLPGGGPATGWTRVPIPSVFEENAAFAGARGVVFLRCPFVFERPLSSENRYRLRFERVVEACHVWLNGAEAGIHVGGDTPFTVDLTGLLVQGPNMLQVAVSRDLQGLPPGCVNVGGILGAVEIVEGAPWSIEDLTCQYLPSVGEGAVELGLEVGASASAVEDLTARFEVFGPAGGAAAVVAEAKVPATAKTAATVAARVSIPSPARWSLSSPHLYTAKATLLRAGRAVDVKLVKFGLRTVEVRGTQFLLNGEPVKLKCATEAGYETGTFLRPTGLFDSQRKVKGLKDAGFNAIRVPGRLAARSLVERANEAGFLVIAEPSARACQVRVVPWLTPAGAVPLPIPIRAEPGPTALRILEEQVRRDRNDPSVVWWGLADAPRAWVRRVHALDADALASRNRALTGSNYLYNPGAGRSKPYLRPEISFSLPTDHADAARILDIGDREEFAFAVLDVVAGLTDFDRVIAGLGGDAWRLEARAFAGRGARLRAAFARDGLDKFFDSPESMILDSQMLRGEFQRRVIETARANVRLGGFAVQHVADSPWAPGTGLYDWFGRPTPSREFASIANAPRRIAVFPERRSGQASSGSGLTDFTRVFFGQLVDVGEPIRILQIETRRPDDISGYSNVVVCERFPYLAQTEVSFGGGEGVYVVHPLWVGLERPEAEQVGLLGVAVAHRPLTRDGPKIVDVEPHLTVVGDVGDLWADEDLFLRVVAALERARQGSVAALFFALTPDSPLVELGCLPGVSLTDAEGLFHAIDGGPVFDKAAVRGSLGDPLNEVAPSHTMRGLSGGERWSVAIDRNGELAGVNFARVPFGKGSVVLTTLRIAESVESSGSARRVVSNVVELLKKGGPVKLEADAGAAARLDDLRERYRRRKQARGY